MSDDEVDYELLELLRQSLLGGARKSHAAPETKVLQGAQYIFDNSIDVALDREQTEAAAETIWKMMQEKHYSMKTWSMHELHPKTKDEKTVDFIFTMDLLNFSFWSERDEATRFCIEYRGKRWTGYWSLVAALQRALDEEIPITSPEFWIDEDECTVEVLQHIFRSVTDEPIPLFEERLQCLREAGRILCDEYEGTFTECIADANGSAAALVNLLADRFPCFRDEAMFEGRRVRFYKRAQILVADLWACFEGKSYGRFTDIGKITMFADYRIPQMLHKLGCLLLSPPLESHLRQRKPLPSGHKWELEMRGTSIWAVELIRQQIIRDHPEANRINFAPKEEERLEGTAEIHPVAEAANGDAETTNGDSEQVNETAEATNSDKEKVNGCEEPADSNEEEPNGAEAAVNGVEVTLNDEVEDAAGTADGKLQTDGDRGAIISNSEEVNGDCGTADSSEKAAVNGIKAAVDDGETVIDGRETVDSKPEATVDDYKVAVDDTEGATDGGEQTKVTVVNGETAADNQGADVDDEESISVDRPEDETEEMGVNAILIDFLLYDTMREMEKQGQETIPHHRTRSIWY